MGRLMLSSGQVIGWSGDPIRRAFIWESGKIIDLGTLPGGNQSEAAAINNHGQIVGTSQTKSDSTHAVMWTLRSG